MVRVVLSLGLVVLVVLGGVGLHAVRDRYQFVEADRLQAALLTFRPAGRDGSDQAGGGRRSLPRALDAY